jgi:hypothetical protein
MTEGVCIVCGRPREECKADLDHAEEAEEE